MLGGQVHVKCDVQKNSFDNFAPEKRNVDVIGNIIICVVVYQRARFFCEINALKHMIKQLLILFILQMKKISKRIPMITKIFKNLMIQMMI